MYYTNAVKYGNNILVRGIANGKQIKQKVQYKPTLFVSTTDTSFGYKDIYGNPCCPIKFNDIRDAMDWQKVNKHTYDILGMDNFVLAYLGDTFPEWKLA